MGRSLGECGPHPRKPLLKPQSGTFFVRLKLYQLKLKKKNWLSILQISPRGRSRPASLFELPQASCRGGLRGRGDAFWAPLCLPSLPAPLIPPPPRPCSVEQGVDEGRILPHCQIPAGETGLRRGRSSKSAEWREGVKRSACNSFHLQCLPLL